jgi:hypothetical protein
MWNVQGQLTYGDVYLEASRDELVVRSLQGWMFTNPGIQV